MKEIAIPIVAISLFIIIINSKFGKICPLRMLIGITCPTCGTTRAVGLLLKGKITEAAMVNPIWIFLLVIIVMVFFYRYVEMAFQKRKRLLKFIDIMIFTTIAVVIAVYIYRMIFWYPNNSSAYQDPHKTPDKKYPHNPPAVLPLHLRKPARLLQTTSRSCDPDDCQ